MFRRETKSPRSNRMPTKVELAKAAQENPFKVSRGQSQVAKQPYDKGGIGFRNQTLSTIARKMFEVQH